MLYKMLLFIAINFISYVIVILRMIIVSIGAKNWRISSKIIAVEIIIIKNLLFIIENCNNSINCKIT